jgi:hypothetical protein
MLTIDPTKVCFVATDARLLDVKAEPVGLESVTNPADDEMLDVLQESEDDPTYEELKIFIDGLNIDEQIELVAITWIGRGDFNAKEWDRACEEARGAHSNHTGAYLLGMPLLPDYLEEGLSEMGYSFAELQDSSL